VNSLGHQLQRGNKLLKWKRYSSIDRCCIALFPLEREKERWACRKAPPASPKGRRPDHRAGFLERLIME